MRLVLRIVVDDVQVPDMSIDLLCLGPDRLLHDGGWCADQELRQGKHLSVLHSAPFSIHGDASVVPYMLLTFA